MFDEPNASGGQPPQNLPMEPVDMFSGVDVPQDATPEQQPAQAVAGMTGGADALSAGVLKRKAPDAPSGVTQSNQSASFSYGASQPGANQPLGYPAKEPVIGRIILFVLTGLVIVGLAIGGWWVYSRFFKKAPATTPTQTEQTTPAPTTPEPTTPVVTTPAPTEATSGISNEIKNDTVLFGESVDTDRDSLPDTQEQQLGTSASIADTDKDGLSDGEEVLVWKTNPLNPDTDGDGYVDGDEVRNGYNPLGPGKLTQPSPATTSTATTSLK